MSSDEKGFYVPNVNEELCIHCEKCIRICPQNNEKSDRKKFPVIYACRAKEEDVQKESASGGFFYILAREILNEGGIVFGAAFNETFSVHHIAVESVSELKALQGSKYVQSNLGDSFKKIEKLLKSGRTVLFSGTPCQVSGLLSYLGGARDNLVTVDMICHGTPSPKIWNEYLHARFEGEHMKDIRFRYKKYGDKKDYFPLMFQTDKVTVFQKYEDNEFIKGFIANLYLKDSCYHCRFKGIDRESDLTIGDFWGIDSIQPGFSNGWGTSLLLIHTKKGNSAFCSVSEELKYAEIPGKNIDQIIANNRSTSFSPDKSAQYEEFWREYLNRGFLKTVERLTRKPVSYYIPRIKHDLKYVVYRTLKPLLKKGKKHHE